jgi:Ser/Thr protein kinase RdoA (MazF antagonist)
MTDAAPTSHALATELGCRLFGKPPLVSRFQAVHSHVFRLDFDRDSPAHVIKIAPDDPAPIVREQQLLRALNRLEFEVPPLEFTQDDCPDAHRPFTVLPVIAGTSAAAIYTQDARRGSATFERLGRFLGRLAALPPATVPGGMPAEEARVHELTLLDEHYAVFSASKWFRKELTTHFQNARLLMDEAPAWFGHRDGGQLITDGHQVFTVVDWGEAGAVWPYADLARHIHAMRTGHDLWGGQWLACLLRGFAEVQPLADGWIETVETWLLYFCLRDAAEMVKTERCHAIPRFIRLVDATRKRQWLQGT